MDKENEIEKFAVLEDRLNKILKGYITLKEEREKLLSQMKDKEGAVERLQEEISDLKNGRLEFRTRIERLIERLEEIPLD